MHRRRSTEVNQTLHDVWPSPALVHYIYILEFLFPNGIQVQNSLYIQLLRSATLAALLHGTRAVGDSQTAAWYTDGITELSLLVIFNRWRYLYSEGGHHVGRICKRGAKSLALTVCHFPSFSDALRWMSSKYSGNYFSRRDAESAVKQ